MADLFSYTPSGSVVAPTSPDIKAVADNPAARTFQALSTLLETGAKVRTQKTQAESAILNEEMQLKRMEIANANAAAVKQEKAQKAARDEYLLQQNITAKGQVSGADALYQENLATLRADDVAGRRKLTADYLASLNEIYSGVDPENQKSMFDYVNGLRTKAQKDYISYAKEYNVNTFLDSMSFVAPQYISAPIEQQKAMYASWQDAASRRGMNLKEFGNEFASIIGSHIAVSLDQNNIVENLDFKSLDVAQQTLNQLAAIDKRAIESVETAQNKLNAARKELTGYVKSQVTLMREAGKEAEFKSYIKIGMDNGIYDETSADAEWRKFVKTTYTPAKIAEANAMAYYGRTNGRVTLSDFTNKDEQSHLKGLVNEQLNAMFSSGQYDADLIKFHSQNNPEQFKTAFNSTFERITNIAKGYAADIQAAKSTEDKQKATSNFIQVIGLMDRHMAQSNGIMTTDQLVKADTIRAIALNGNVVNIQEAFNNIEQQGGVRILDDSKTRDLYKEVPTDMTSEAVRVYSALVASNMPREDAYEVVKNSYRFEEVDDVSFGISGNVMTAFRKADTGVDSLKMLEKVILNDGTLPGLPDETFTEEVRESVQAVLGGTNPTARFYKGHLFFENEEGSTAAVLMGQEQINKLSEAMNTAFRASTEGQPPTGIPRIAEDFVKEVAPMLSSIKEDVSGIFEAIGDTVILGGTAIAPSWEAISESFSSLGSSTNQLIDDLYSGKDWGAAMEAHYSRQKKAGDKFAMEHGFAKHEAWKKFKESWFKVGDSLKIDTEAGMEAIKSGAGSAVKAISTFLISEAEGANVPISTEYFKQSGMLTSLQVEPMAFNPNKFIEYIGKRAEGRHGYDPKELTYMPVATNDARERNKPKDQRSKDIGYGHKITDAEWKSGTIHGHKFVDDRGNIIPLFESQIQDIMQKDMAQNLTGVLPNWNKKINDLYENRDFGDLAPAAQAVLSSLAYNVGSNSAKSWKEIFNNDGLFYPVMVPDEVVKFASDLRRKDAGKNTAGMDNRVMKELVAAGLIYDQYTFDMVAAALPLMNEFDSYESTLM